MLYGARYSRDVHGGFCDIMQGLNSYRFGKGTLSRSFAQLPNRRAQGSGTDRRKFLRLWMGVPTSFSRGACTMFLFIFCVSRKTLPFRSRSMLMRPRYPLWNQSRIHPVHLPLLTLLEVRRYPSLRFCHRHFRVFLLFPHLLRLRILFHLYLSLPRTHSRFLQCFLLPLQCFRRPCPLITL